MMLAFRNIGWMTFVLSLVLSLNYLSRNSHDDQARHLAATGTQTMNRLNQSTQSLSDDQLENFRALSQLVPSK